MTAEILAACDRLLALGADEVSFSLRRSDGYRPDPVLRVYLPRPHRTQAYTDFTGHDCFARAERWLRERNENDTERDLEAQLAAHPMWRWAPGMAFLTRSGTGTRFRLSEEGPRQGASPVPSAVPDLADPATLGCLLAMLREASDDGATVVRHWRHGSSMWCVYGDDYERDLRDQSERGVGDTEGEAIARALLAAWGAP